MKFVEISYFDIMNKKELKKTISIDSILEVIPAGDKTEIKTTRTDYILNESYNSFVKRIQK